ncbi:unnamed protein product [Enterobius vermicularis]|uniref:TDP43_N domain-containing protein n=1 Tax=Enterobius vermicularis TaxID=51028 RepID=A0A0N4VP40_ENTVE|nr:unnamed protein product [Enterobius vermicularis]
MDEHPPENSYDNSEGWVHLQIEPVDIPLEHDKSLLLSAVQSAIPGAHGIYYLDNGQKKAFKYDSSTGRIYQGPPGWHSKPLYVVLGKLFNNFSSNK